MSSCLIAKGVASLSEQELLALVIGSPHAKQLAADLLQRAGSLVALERLGLQQLRRFYGMGVARSLRVKAALELGRRLLAGDERQPICFHSSDAVVDHLRPQLAWQQREHFVVLLLDSRHRLLRQERLTMGTTNCLHVHPRDVFHLAAQEMATAVIVVHNHPGGDPQPSSEDVALTARLLEAGQLLGIVLLDHIIVADAGCFYSFRDSGTLTVLEAPATL